MEVHLKKYIHNKSLFWLLEPLEETVHFSIVILMDRGEIHWYHVIGNANSKNNDLELNSTLNC